MSKTYEIKYEDKSIFFKGDLDYLFNALYEPETISKTSAEIINLASFIMFDEESNKIIKKKRGRPKLIKEPKVKRPRGRPRKPPITTEMMTTKLLDMVKQYNLVHGIVIEDVNNDIDKIFEPYCVST